MLQGGDVLLASHTGSGKTLAYLLPLVWNQRILSFRTGHAQTCIILWLKQHKHSICSAVAPLHVLFLICPIGCVAAVQCSLLAHCRCTSCGNKSRMGSRPSRDAPEHWFWVPPGSSLTRSCKLPSHSVIMPASDQHVLMEVMLCQFTVPCMCWQLTMAWICSTMKPEAASIVV